MSLSAFYYLILAVILLVCCREVSALEALSRPQNFPVLAGPKLPDEQSAIFYQVFKDAIFLARYTAVHWPCPAETDEIFLRYFKPDQADFVKNMFRTLANIPLDLDLGDAEAVADLMEQPSYHPKFTQMSINFLGNHRGLNLPNGPGVPAENCKTNLRTGGPIQAFVVAPFNGKSALVSFCKDAFTKPMLKDVLQPPKYAIDPSKTQKDGPQFYEGYGCDNLGDTESSWFESTAFIMLHEMFHFPGLFVDVPDYDTLITPYGIINGNGNGAGKVNHLIVDWFGDFPKTGYGSYNARMVNGYTPYDGEGESFLPIFNADNYALYAIVSYYSRECGRTFKPAQSDESFWKARHPANWPFSIPLS